MFSRIFNSHSIFLSFSTYRRLFFNLLVHMSFPRLSPDPHLHTKIVCSHCVINKSSRNFRVGSSWSTLKWDPNWISITNMIWKRRSTKNLVKLKCMTLVYACNMWIHILVHIMNICGRFSSYIFYKCFGVCVCVFVRIHNIFLPSVHKQSTLKNINERLVSENNPSQLRAHIFIFTHWTPAATTVASRLQDDKMQMKSA